MKAYLSEKAGGPESLQLTDVTLPEMGPEEVLLRVTAVGINRVDAMQRSGIYPPPPGTSDILGVECAGEVVEVGDRVEGVKIGMRAIALVAAGAYAEYVAVNYQHIVETPADWSDAKAASVIETFCTAHETLFELGRLKQGERALIHAAGSAVGTTAIQMAVHRGATVIGTAGAAEKIEGAKKLGASHVINYKTCDFADEVLDIYPEGVDFIEDFIGPLYFERHLRIIRWLGRITMVGLLTTGKAEADTAPILGKRLSINGFTLRPQTVEEKAAIVSRFKKHWMPELIKGSVNPVVYAELPFSNAAECHRILDENRNFGKVIMTL